MFGSALLGLWTAPGLEDLPSLDLLGRKEVAEEETKPESGIFPMQGTSFLPPGVSVGGEGAEPAVDVAKPAAPGS